MLIFQSIPVLNGLSKITALVQKRKEQFLESSPSFPNEICKKEQIQIFYCLIINSLRLAGRW